MKDAGDASVWAKGRWQDRAYGTASAQDGFFVGGALQPSDHLHLTAGVSLSKGQGSEFAAGERLWQASA